jgi:Kef-type K+ transport system membrane component KefB
VAGLGKKTDAVTQATIVLILVAAIYALHYFAGDPQSALDPRPMMALGFVVLASYAIGAGFDVIGLPHITGYIVAGIIFGPSLAHLLPAFLEWFGVKGAPPPFDEGILSEAVIDDLGRLDGLAIALIAMTAGGELKIDALRRGIVRVASLVGGLTLVVGVAATLFFLVVSGVIPAIALPGIGELTLTQGLSLGFVTAAIVVATSPAAVIAVITETRSQGEMTRMILSAVVFIDVVVVVLFGFTSVFAARSIGLGETSSSLAAYLTMHIGGAIALGVAVGAGMAFYLRFVGRQLLIFLLAVVFAVSYIAEIRDLDRILLFLAAGFVFSNFSPRAGALIHSIEQLSAPVYVVFFTLAGARLHIAEFVQVLPFAATLAIVRFFAMWGGTRLATRGAPENDPTRRVGFLGFIAQAGVALSLAAVVGRDLGEPGRALSTVLFGMIALNELVGPVLLKMALGFAGEIGKAPQRTLEGLEQPLGLVAEAPSGAPVAEPEPVEPAKPEGEDGLSTTGLKPWRPGAGPRDFWGAPARTASPELNRKLNDLETELQGIVRDVTNGPLQSFRGDAEFFIRDLRREFLRHHRRLTVQARTDEERANLAGMLRIEQAKLADRWRGIVLGRSAKIGRGGFSPEELCTPLDRVADALPEVIEVSWEDESFLHRESESVGQTALRSWLRWRRTFHKLLGAPMPKRRLELRDLARYYLSGWAPNRFEGIAALLITADRHLASRVRSVFDGIVRGYDKLATRVEEPEFDANDALQTLRQQVDREISLALEELRRIHLDGTRRVAGVLGDAMTRIKKESKVYGTLDLPPSRRNFKRLHRQRTVEIAALSQQLVALRRTGAGGYPLLAMELEIVGLEARVKDAVEANVSRVEKEVRRRASLQAERVLERLDEAVVEIKETIVRDVTGAEMATELRGIADRVEKVAGEASRIARELQTDLLDERKVAPLLDALTEAAVALTGTYRVAPGRLVAGEYRLPPAGQPIVIEFREQVLHRIESHVAPKLLASARDAAERVGPLGESLAELERLIAFNGELALAELEVVHDEPVPTPIRELLEEMITGHLERSRGVVQGYVNASRHWPRDLGNGMRDSVLGVLEELRDDLVTGEISEAKLAARRRAEGRGRFVRLVTELPQRLTESRREAGEAFRRVLGDDRLEDLRGRVGLPTPRVDVEAAPAAFAAPTPSAELPLVYRRLFAADTMEAVDVIAGYESEIERASRALSADSKGTLRTVMLVGSDGVGKGALAGAIVRSRRWKNVRRVQITEPLTAHDVDALFAEKGEGQLVVVDGIQWLSSLKPGGFEPLRRFVDIVVNDAGRRAWLVNADVLFYAFASSVARLEAAFPTRVKLRPLDAAELKAAILERQEMSGYAYVFDRSAGEGPLARSVARVASRWSRPYDRYFEDLHRESGGLVRDALRLWLASIQKIEGNELVHLGVVPRSGFRALSRLPEKTLVTLHQIVRQGWMDADTMAFLFRTDGSAAHAELARLEYLGLLQRQGQLYRVATHLRGALLRVLEERGWQS